MLRTLHNLLLISVVLPLLAATTPTSQSTDAATARKQFEEAQKRLSTAQQNATAAQARLDHQLNMEEGLANEADAAQTRVEQSRAAAGQVEARRALAARDAKEAGMRIDKLTAAQPVAQARLDKARGDVKDFRDRATQTFHASEPYTKTAASIEAAQAALNDEIDGVRRELADRADYQALQDAAESAEANLRQIRNDRTADAKALAATSRAWMSAIEAVNREERENDDADYFVIEARKALVVARGAMTQLVAKFEKDLLADPGTIALNAAVAAEQGKTKQIAGDLVEAKNELAAAQAAAQKLASAAQDARDQVADAQRQVQNLNDAIDQTRNNELWSQRAADDAYSAANSAWADREIAARIFRDAVGGGSSQPPHTPHPPTPGQPSTQPSPTPSPVPTTQPQQQPVVSGEKGGPAIDPQSPVLTRPARIRPAYPVSRQPAGQTEVVEVAPVEQRVDATPPAAPPTPQAPNRTAPAKDNSDKPDPDITADSPGLERPGATTSTPARSRKQ